MEASSIRKRLGGGSPRDLLSTREGALAVAVGAALLAGLLILLFVKHYRDDVNGKAAAKPVLVARGLIAKGSSGEVIAGQRLFAPASLKGAEVKTGAISDPAKLASLAAARDIYPGQQLTAADFVPVRAAGVSARVSGDQRAISVPVDAAHGSALATSGNRVDVMVALGGGSSGGGGASLRTLLQNVLVLNAPDAGGGGISGGSGASNITLRVTDREAPKLAFAADNGKLWIVARPAAGARQSRPATVSLQSLLSGSR